MTLFKLSCVPLQIWLLYKEMGLSFLEQLCKYIDYTLAVDEKTTDDKAKVKNFLFLKTCTG